MLLTLQVFSLALHLSSLLCFLHHIGLLCSFCLAKKKIAEGDVVLKQFSSDSHYGF